MSGVLLCAAVFLAVAAAAPPARAGDGVELVRLAEPGFGPEDADGDGIEPRLLGTADAVRYRRIFRLQEDGEWDAADALIARLDDPVLLAEVQAQRYLHPTAYRSSYDELRAWLERYPDHPEAPRIHRLAVKRRPAGAPPPPEPVPGYLTGAGQELLRGSPLPPYRTTRERSAEQDELVRAWRETIVDLVRRERPTEALHEQLDRRDIAPLIDEVEHDRARWIIARGYFDAGKDAEALRLADPAAARSGRIEPGIHWTAGLAAWRLGRPAVAARHFAAVAVSERASDAEAARGAFWAARAHLRGGRPHLFNRYMEVAAARGHGFYGLLARAVFGERFDFNWYEQGLEDGLLEVLWRFPGARRALALAQVGRYEQAEREIRKLGARVRSDLCVALVALANALELPAAEMRVAQRLRLADGRDHHGALFPLPRWQPADGFRLDRALIYAVARAESGFDAAAESRAGARGLMQLMPVTVAEAAERLGQPPPDADELLEPPVNLALGQAYLERLLQSAVVEGNLFYLAAAYNCGPTCLARWRKALAVEDDPLLFLEALPSEQTRAYVKKVMLNLWTYRARLGQPTPSLRDLAENRWPLYRALDSEARLHHARR